MKTKLNSLLIGLALAAGVHPALAQPTLGIAPAGNQSVLFWPLTFTNYLVQSTTNLASPNWVWANDAIPAIVAGQTAFAITDTLPARFFRLSKIATTSNGMVLIPAGSFRMGNYLFSNSATNNPDITDANPTEIYVSAFYMDVNEVSWSQWQTVYTYATNHGYRFFTNTIYGVYQAGGKAANHPVQTLNWFDCVKWSNARSQQAGLTPVYYTDAVFTQVYTNGEPTTVYQKLAANGYRLPTEAEWEKAARGGLAGNRFPWGNSISQSQANYYGATGSYSYDLGPNGFHPFGNFPTDSVGTSPVGSFPANGYGLNDMAGNIFEWCWDWHGTPYGQPTTNNPTGAGPGSGVRVLRGGDWRFVAFVARCAQRYCYVPDYTGYAVGFRCVRGL